MKKDSGKIKVGTASKYTKVKMDIGKIVSLYKSGKPVSQIALALGFPPNCGQNRTRRVLVQAGVYQNTFTKKRTAKKATKAA